jgi:hypothetical protein
MSLAAQMAADMTVFLNTAEFAASVVYTARGGSPKTIDAVVDYGTDQIGDAQDGRNRSRHATVHISRDATAGIAAPAPGDAVTLSSEEWVVEAVVSQDSAGATLSLVRTEPIRRTGQGRVLERS